MTVAVCVTPAGVQEVLPAGTPAGRKALKSPRRIASVGSVTTLSNLLRMLYSRAGDYPPDQPIIYAEAFSPNTAAGACARRRRRSRVRWTGT